MKTKFALLVAGTILTGLSYGQAVFSVKPGLNLSGFSVGYKSGKIIPNIGMQYYGGVMEDYDDTGTLDSKTSIRLLLPSIGSKVLVLDNEELTGYVSGSLMLPILTGKSIVNGTEDPDFKKTLKETKFWGFEIGYGMEYAFAKQFSIGGEMGFRGAKYKNESSITNWTTKARLNMTYTTISLNYYISRKE